MTNRPAWTLTEAVQRTGASRSTLRRYLDAGKFPHAYKDSSKAWRFPLEDLLAAGLRPTEPANEQTLSKATEHTSTATDEQVSRLEQALREERTRADNAERLAASYLDNVHDLRRALLMLEAGTGKPEQPNNHAQSVVTEQAKPATDTPTHKPLSVPEQPRADTPKAGLSPDPPKAPAMTTQRSIIEQALNPALKPAGRRFWPWRK